MEKDRQVTYVKSRAEIVEMMEKLYDLMMNHKADPARIIIMTDVLDWVISDSDYLEDFIKEREKNDIN